MQALDTTSGRRADLLCPVEYIYNEFSKTQPRHQYHPQTWIFAIFPTISPISAFSKMPKIPYNRRTARRVKNPPIGSPVRNLPEISVYFNTSPARPIQGPINYRSATSRTNTHLLSLRFPPSQRPISMTFASRPTTVVLTSSYAQSGPRANQGQS